jgi:hypothetical protein
MRNFLKYQSISSISMAFQQMIGVHSDRSPTLFNWWLIHSITIGVYATVSLPLPHGFRICRKNISMHNLRRKEEAFLGPIEINFLLLLLALFLVSCRELVAIRLKLTYHWTNMYLIGRSSGDRHSLWQFGSTVLPLRDCFRSYK